MHAASARRELGNSREVALHRLPLSFHSYAWTFRSLSVFHVIDYVARLKLAMCCGWGPTLGTRRSAASSATDSL